MNTPKEIRKKYKEKKKQWREENPMPISITVSMAGVLFLIVAITIIESVSSFVMPWPTFLLVTGVMFLMPRITGANVWQKKMRVFIKELRRLESNEIGALSGYKPKEKKEKNNDLKW